jgi:hypothetical protein
MHDQHADEKYPGRSRRRFLREAAGLAAAGAATAAVGPAAPIFAGAQQLPEPSSAPGDCDCSADSALPLLAAAVVDGGYVALASTSAGPRLFSLTVDDARAVSLGAALPFQAPAEFEASSLGVARNRLVLSGASPFLWRSYQVDNQVEPIQVFGVGPAAFFLNPGFVEPIALPDTSAQVFATVGGVAETSSGNLVVMIEHSGGEPESRYAAAVDVFEEAPGGWSLRASARDLGESGPNHLVVEGDAVGAELNTSRGMQVVGSGAPSPASARTALSPDILGDDQVVSVVPVAGAKGQSVVIGNRSARLVEEVAHVL